MAKKRKRIRYDKNGCVSPRKLLDNGDWRQLSFDEKVFTALVWCGFSNTEAWSVIKPSTEATANSQAVMAGRYACNAKIKVYIEVLNKYLMSLRLRFKGQDFNIGDTQEDEQLKKIENV